jgi:hypothetical protein
MDSGSRFLALSRFVGSAGMPIGGLSAIDTSRAE